MFSTKYPTVSVIALISSAVMILLSIPTTNPTKIQEHNSSPNQSVPRMSVVLASSPILSPSIEDKTNNSQPTPTPDLIPPATSHNLKLGIVVDDYSNQTGQITEIEKLLGQQISTVSIFKQFGHPTNQWLDLEQLQYVKNSNKKLLLAWEPWNPLENHVDYLDQINRGQLDDYIDQFAQQVQEYGHPVIIRFGHEMNGNWYPWGQRPEEYIQAYRRVVQIFRDRQITNASWMWSVNATTVPWEPISQSVDRFYPGADFVDIVGIDGFNFGNDQWTSFANIFQAAYSHLTNQYSQHPIVISETASSELGGSKSGWIEAMLTSDLPQKFPLITEIVWFNLNKEADWRINSSSEASTTFSKYL